MAFPPPARRSFAGTGRRAAAASALRVVLTTSALTWIYFAVPVSRTFTRSGGVLLVTGLVSLIVFFPLQVRSIMRSGSPRLRAVEVLASAVALLVLLFALSYFLVADHDPSAFSEPLSRLDALYLTITVLATGQFDPVSVAVDAMYVYWANFGYYAGPSLQAPATINKVPKTGGPVTTLYTAGPQDIA